MHNHLYENVPHITFVLLYFPERIVHYWSGWGWERERDGERGTFWKRIVQEWNFFYFPIMRRIADHVHDVKCCENRIMSLILYAICVIYRGSYTSRHFI